MYWCLSTTTKTYLQCECGAACNLTVDADVHSIGACSQRACAMSGGLKFSAQTVIEYQELTHAPDTDRISLNLTHFRLSSSAKADDPVFSGKQCFY
jgi:hypothetical protein